MVRIVALLALVTGCRQLLGFEEPSDPAATDGPRVDDGPRADGEIADGAPDGATACPASYTLTISSSLSQYRHVTNSAIPWLNANADCVNDGTSTHLIVLSNETELAEIEAVTGTLERWVGHSSRATANEILPVTDEPTTFPPASGPPWAVGEPNAETDCVAVSATGELRTLSCGNGRTFICECDQFASDPNNF